MISARDITPAEFSRRTGITYSHLYRLINGKSAMLTPLIWQSIYKAFKDDPGGLAELARANALDHVYSPGDSMIRVEILTKPTKAERPIDTAIKLLKDAAEKNRTVADMVISLSKSITS